MRFNQTIIQSAYFMSDDLEARIHRLIAFGRYLSWADLLFRVFEEEMNREVNEADVDILNEHNWRWYGLMCYWYSSLYVVVEAWDEIGFSDALIDRLLSHPKRLKKLLRRYRNAIFHYQQTLLDPRFIELLDQGDLGIYWVQTLHDEFMRFFSNHLANLMITDSQGGELRKDIESLLHWYPYRESPHLASLEQTIYKGREVLAQYPDESSLERRELEQILVSAESTLEEGRRNWSILRAQFLSKAGIK
jgi:hypothetical protein